MTNALTNQHPVSAAELAPALLHLAAQLGAGDPRAGVARMLREPRCNALQPLLYRAAQLGALALDARESERCAHMYFQAVATVQTVQAELAAIAGWFAAAGIPLLVMKGGAFVSDLYAEPGVRPAGDLDLLVPPERVEDATRALQAQGYSLVSALDLHGLRSLARPGRPPDKGNIDLHARVAPARAWTGPGYPVDVSAIWRRALPLPLPGSAHPPLQMSHEDALLFIGFQITQHGFSKLYNYFDVHALLTAGVIDDARLAEIAGGPAADGTRGHPFRVSTYCALQATRALLGTPVPESWLACTRPSRLRQALIARWASPSRILAARIPEDHASQLVILARSPRDVARMAASVTRYFASKALGRA